MSKNGIGCLVFVAIASLILICIGGVMLNSAPGLAAQAASIAGMEPQTAEAVNGAEPGQAVIVAGQIDPETPAPARGLALYRSERYERETTRGRRGRNRTSNEWNEAESFTPSFVLLTEDGQVSITDESYELDTPTYDEPGENEVGNLRYEGFKPGDSVLVVGKTDNGGMDAESVFGGTREQYVAALRGRSSSNVRWGSILLGLGLLPGIVALVMGVRLFTRRPRQSAVAPADADGASVPQVSFGGAEGPVAEPAAGQRCVQCGAPLAGSATFCGSCGARVAAPPAEGPV